MIIIYLLLRRFSSMGIASGFYINIIGVLEGQFVPHQKRLQTPPSTLFLPPLVAVIIKRCTAVLKRAALVTAIPTTWNAPEAWRDGGGDEDVGGGGSEQYSDTNIWLEKKGSGGSGVECGCVVIVAVRSMCVVG